MDRKIRPEVRLTPLPPEHTPELAAQFEATRIRMGYIPNALLIMQRRPKMVQGYTALAAAIWDQESTVPLGFKRLIAYVVSRSAGCQYCMAHTAEGAIKLGIEFEKLDAVWEISNQPPVQRRGTYRLGHRHLGREFPQRRDR
ncbi:MAG: peroxidase [Bradyrhizobium sp.]|nr:peroxidase [Bradyrhizobium sp.]